MTFGLRLDGSKRAILLYTLFQLFFNLLLWVPIFYEFQKRLGLTDPQIFGIQSIYYLVFCFLEIPTGYFADRWGYRTSLLTGGVVLVAANLLPGVEPTYTGMLWHFLAIALARSLISGASSAWLYEYLKAQGHSEHYKRIEGDTRFYSLVAKVAAWAVVGYLMAYKLFLPYWISAANALVALVCAYLLPVVSAKETTATPTAAEAVKTNTVAVAYRSIKASPLIVLYMLQGVGIFVMVRVLQVNLYQPILGDKGFDVAAFGWIMSIMTVFEAFGSKMTPLVRDKLTDATAVFLVNLVIGACLVAIATGGQALTLAGFCVFSLASGLVFPVQKQLLNDSIADGRARAILLSTESILDRAVCAVAVLPLGQLVKEQRLPETLIVCAVATAVGTWLVHMLVKRLRGEQMALQKVAAILLCVVGIGFAARPARAEAASDWVFFDLGEVIVTGNPNEGYTYIPGIRDYLHELKGRGYKLALISNIPETWGPTCAGKLAVLKELLGSRLHETEPMDWAQFDAVIVPPFDRYRKPHSYMFLRALEAACGGRALYVGENSQERDQARGLGFAVYDGPEKPLPYPAADAVDDLMRGFRFAAPAQCRFDAIIAKALLQQDRSNGVEGCVLR